MRISITFPKRMIAMSGLVLGAAIALSSLGVVRAERFQPDKSKTYSCSGGYACLEAKSSGSSTIGLFAAVNGGSSNEAVYGQANLGVGVLGNASNGYGVSGEGALAGVFGEATNVGTSTTPGVYGYTTTDGAGTIGANLGGGIGIYGVSVSTYGVEGYSNSGPGVYGDGGYGLLAEATSVGYGPAIYAIGDGPSTSLFFAWNASTGKECAIDYNANMVCSGQIIGGGGVLARHHSSNGQRVLAYASESASATMEDVGEARLLNGVANVMIPSDFASVIDRNSNYYVFLTPLGETRGLYVSMKTAGGFQVRENDRGRTSVAFDYRIVARPIDASADRLPAAPRMHRPVLTAHRGPLALPQLPKLAH
ncbi:MAG: hypothetical protein JO146_02565 [Candidatus Eremiobacteraeota bacterium]|nr:hypothetical protein [Candidatus Eremiobacteraeota bacterium]